MSKLNFPPYLYDDLLQIGSIALLEAEQKFDPSKGNFEAFAFVVIRNSLLTFLQNEAKHSNLIKIQNNDQVFEHYSNQLTYEQDFSTPKEDNSQQILNNLSSLEKSVLKLSINENKSLDEIAQILNIPREKVRQLREKAKRRIKAEQL